MPNNYLSVLYKVENENVGLKVCVCMRVCVCVCVWGGGGGGHKHTIAPHCPFKNIYKFERIFLMDLNIWFEIVGSVTWI